MATHTDGSCALSVEVVLNGTGVDHLRRDPQETHQGASSSESFPSNHILLLHSDPATAQQLQRSSLHTAKHAIDCHRQSEKLSHSSTTPAEAKLSTKGDLLNKLLAEEPSLNQLRRIYPRNVLRELVEFIIAEKQFVDRISRPPDIADQKLVLSAHGIGNLDDFIGSLVALAILLQRLQDSFLSTINPRNQSHEDLATRFLRAPQTLYTIDPELSDDSENSNEYRLMVRARDVEDGNWAMEELDTLVDTGAEKSFIFPAGLAKISRVKRHPIPRGKLRAYESPINPDAPPIVPRYFVRLILWNDKVGLNDTVDLRIFELPEGTSGLHIILGRRFMKKHGDREFLPKVAEASADGSCLAAAPDNSFNALLSGKTSKKQKLINKRIDGSRRVQEQAIHDELYKKFQEPSSGTSLGTQSTGTHHSAGFPHADSQTMVKLPSLPSDPNYGGPAAQQPVPDYPSEWRSQRTYTSSTHNTDFSFGRQSTNSSMSSWASVPDCAPAEDRKLAGYTADDAVPQGYNPSQKQ